MQKNFIDAIRPKDHVSGGESAPTERIRRRRTGKSALWITATVVVVIVVGLIVTTLRATASVKVTPVQQVVTVDHIFASHDTLGDGPGIPFRRLELTDAQGLTVPATGIRTVSEKARGILIVLNTSDKTQNFVAQTRFQSARGQVYRAQKALNIPAARKDGATVTPGSAEVLVIADTAGADGNLEAGASLTVPGLKGGPLFSKVSAKAKTAMMGGFRGDVKSAAPADIKAAEDQLKATLTTRLLEKARAQMPEGSILYDDAIVTIFTSTPDSALPKDTFGEQMEGKLIGFLFTRADLAKEISGRTATDLASSSVDAIGLEKLTMRILGKSSIDPSADSRFSFSIQGSLKLVWQFDEERLKKTLSGVARDRYQEVFREFPTIERAEATFRPKWRGSFPSDPTKIDVETIITP